jgi:hypothetical protein
MVGNTGAHGSVLKKAHEYSLALCSDPYSTDSRMQVGPKQDCECGCGHR